MLRNLLFAVITFFNTTAFSQNLILNPGLEIVDPAYELPEPDTFGYHNIPGWFNPSFATTDYYNSDGKHAYCGSRFFGKEIKAHSGNGYAGIYLDKTKWREYIAVVLNDTLVAGQNYRLSMWLSISQKSRYALNSLQVEFWDTTYNKIARENSAYPKTNELFPPNSFTRTNQTGMVGNWVQVSMDFTAVGGERMFVLGYMADFWATTSMPETAKNKNNDPIATTSLMMLN